MLGSFTSLPSLIWSGWEFRSGLGNTCKMDGGSPCGLYTSITRESQRDRIVVSGFFSFVRKTGAYRVMCTFTGGGTTDNIQPLLIQCDQEVISGTLDSYNAPSPRGHSAAVLVKTKRSRDPAVMTLGTHQCTLTIRPGRHARLLRWGYMYCPRKLKTVERRATASLGSSPTLPSRAEKTSKLKGGKMEGGQRPRKCLRGFVHYDKKMCLMGGLEVGAGLRTKL
ncbi:hypothetical protein AVEN_149965-1 [Araneus ventricosus]|uniref:Uncharacterized protein n=1 Tax=Araneus ventricosus TaxID=182803 RepID=A0A4Y2WM05_ARAVE|nr:hypothetical protein AVEN_149965-1 [Araneus ventricosus]